MKARGSIAQGVLSHAAEHGRCAIEKEQADEGYCLKRGTGSTAVFTAVRADLT